jgi:hypothetical protein
MKHISDDDLVLLYYGEHDDPGLAAEVAKSPELSERFEALCAELKLADAYQPPARPDDYGADVWQRIAPRLAAARPGSPGRIGNRLRAWWSAFGQPRFSFAGMLAVALVAVVAFMLGRNGTHGPAPVAPGPLSEPAALLAGIDPGRLLSSSVSGHLEQVDLVLTEFANSAEAAGNQAAWATDLLIANRLYRRAAAARDEDRLADFLGQLEPLLIELAHEAHAASPTSRERMQGEIRDGLLFRVRVMSEQLKKPEIST